MEWGEGVELVGEGGCSWEAGSGVGRGRWIWERKVELEGGGGIVGGGGVGRQ